MLFHELPDAIDFATAKTTATMQSHRVEPELSYLVVALNMNVFWFVAITGVEVNRYGPFRKTVGIDSPFLYDRDCSQGEA